MKRIDTLKREALDACNFRGHVMSNFHRFNDNHFRAVCFVCGKIVDVIPKPAPNETEIAGEAVALGCKD